MPYADPEAIVKAFLAGVFPTAGADRVRITTGGTDRVRNLQHAARYITVEKLPTSPGDAQPTLDVADVEVNYFARNRDRAKNMANTAHVALRYLMERHTDPATGAFVKQVRVTGAPAETPWDESDTARYTATYRLWIHHNPLS